MIARTNSLSLIRFAALTFPAAIFGLACLFYFGDLGKWADDLLVGQAPDGSAPSHYTMKSSVFMRPLYFVTAPPLQTLLWQHDRIHHLLMLAVHMAAAGLFYRLLRSLGACVHTSAAMAMIALVSPLGAHYAFWLCNLPATLSLCCAIGALLTSVRYARTGGNLKERLLLLAAIALLSILSPCLYEQPATMLIAVPFLVFAACPDIGQRRVGKVAAATLAAGIPCVVYVALFALTMGRESMGLVEPGGLMRRIDLVLSNSVKFIRLHGMGESLFFEGVQALRANAAITVVWVVVLALCAIVGVKVWTRFPTHQPREKDKSPRFDPLALTLGGLAVFLAGHLPFIASASYPFQHRHSYVPMLGLLMAFGAAAEWFGRQVAEKKWAARYRAATGIALLAVLAPLTIMMLGQQHLMRTRWLMDLDIGRQLRELVPNPASGSLFVPVRSDDRAMRRGPDWFRRSVVGIFQTNWSAGNAYQLVYRRADVFGTNAGDFGERPVSVGVDEVRIAPPPYMQAPAFAPDWRWPRQRVVEFSIDEQGIVSVQPKSAPLPETSPAH